MTFCTKARVIKTATEWIDKLKPRLALVPSEEYTSAYVCPYTNANCTNGSIVCVQ